jgi:glycosyltransferase involved in cell wall biosynthesis
MKVLMVNYEYPPLGGGCANAMSYIIKEFTKDKDLDIDVVTSSTNKFKIENISDNIKLHKLDIGKKNQNLHYQTNKELITFSLKANKYIKNLIKDNDYDLIHSFFGIPCGFLVKNHKIPFIVSLRGSDVPFYSLRYEMLDKLIFQNLSRGVWKKANHVTVNSKYLKNLAKKTKHDQKFELIYNGIDLEEFRVPKNFEKKESKKFKIISVGRLIERKGFEYIIEAISELKDVELTIVGDGPIKKKLENLAQRLNSNCKFTGNVKHSKIPEILWNSDLFVIASISESLSNTMLEALAASLPVITTNTGTAELIYENGYIVEPENSQQIRDKIIELKSNINLKEEMSKRSIKIAEELSWETISANLIPQQF